MWKRTPKKYKLILERDKNLNKENFINIYRLQALRDIPEHGVKAGDFGGLVTEKHALSHSGSCWIGENAQVFTHIYVVEDAYIGGNAYMVGHHNIYGMQVSGKARIEGDAKILCLADNKYAAIKTPMEISDNVVIAGGAVIINPLEIKDNARIDGNAYLESIAIIGGNSKISDNVTIGEGAIVLGESTLLDTVSVGNYAKVYDSQLANDFQVLPYSKIEGTHQDTLETPMIEEPISEPSSGSSLVMRMKKRYDELIKRIDSYETDIVKLIKYPAMTDCSIPEILEMVIAKNDAMDALQDEANEEEIISTVKTLQNKFLIAESYALKVSATKLSELERKHLQKAKDLFRVAANEASSEHEKKVAFIQGFKQLEGVIAVPDVAVDTFRIKVGLKELEA